MPTSEHKPILSVCIPTYNRPKEFERMIAAVLPQLTDEVELLVRDDSTDDETKKIFDTLVKDTHVAYRYIKGEKIGLDAANLFLIEQARGKYVWWFSDDDEMRPGAIEKILHVVKKQPDISFVWINFDFARPHNPAVVREEGFFADRDEVIEVLGTNIGLLSSLLFSRVEALASLPHARKHIVGFSFAGLVPIFTVLSGPGRFYFLKGPYVLCHPTTTEEIKVITRRTGEIKNEAFNVYGVDYRNIMLEFSDAFSRRAIRKALAINFGALWRGMLVGWVGGWDTPKGKRWRMFTYYWSFPECWIALPLFLLPRWVSVVLYHIYKIFFDHRKFVFGRKRAAV